MRGAREVWLVRAAPPASFESFVFFVVGSWQLVLSAFLLTSEQRSCTSLETREAAYACTHAYMRVLRTNGREEFHVPVETGLDTCTYSTRGAGKNNL